MIEVTQVDCRKCVSYQSARIADDSPCFHCYYQGNNRKSYFETVPTKKPVDLSVLIGSGIDCEFAEFHTGEYRNDWILGTLKDIVDNYQWSHKDERGNHWRKCRPRLNHIHAWQGGKCPLPEGFRVKVHLRGNRDHRSWSKTCALGEVAGWAHRGEITDIIAFEVIGLHEDYCYPWEIDND